MIMKLIGLESPKIFFNSNLINDKSTITIRFIFSALLSKNSTNQFACFWSDLQ